MMDPHYRLPPRFVPTLTDVVPEGLPIKQPAVNGEGNSAPSSHAYSPKNSAICSSLLKDSLASTTSVTSTTPINTQNANTVGEGESACEIKAAMIEELLGKALPIIEERLRLTIENLVSRHSEMLQAQIQSAVQEVLEGVVQEALEVECSQHLNPKDRIS